MRLPIAHNILSSIPFRLSIRPSIPTANPIYIEPRLRRLATMQSHACCTVPPVQSKGYSQKGSFETIDGMKTYVTGSSDASSAILVCYDIFGLDIPQTIQGADILASGDNKHKYQVFMPGTETTTSGTAKINANSIMRRLFRGQASAYGVVPS